MSDSPPPVGNIPVDPPPPTPEQVLAFLHALQRDLVMGRMFERMARWGMPNGPELTRFERFRTEWLKSNNLAHLNLNGFFGANMLFRRIAWGRIESLDHPDAVAFLHEDAVRNVIDRNPPAGGITTVRIRLDEAMWLANDIVLRQDFWPLLADDFRHRGEVGRWFTGDEQLASFWYSNYAVRNGVANRGTMRLLAAMILEEVALGRIDGFNSPQAWVYLNNQHAHIFSFFKEEFGH